MTPVVGGERLWGRGGGEQVDWISDRTERDFFKERNSVRSNRQEDLQIKWGIVGF